MHSCNFDMKKLQNQGPVRHPPLRRSIQKHWSTCCRTPKSRAWFLVMLLCQDMHHTGFFESCTKHCRPFADELHNFAGYLSGKASAAIFGLNPVWWSFAALVSASKTMGLFLYSAATEDHRPVHMQFRPPPVPREAAVSSHRQKKTKLPAPATGIRIEGHHTDTGS